MSAEAYSIRTEQLTKRFGTFTAVDQIDVTVAKGEVFGFPRLRALIAQHGEEVRALRELLMKELHSFTGEKWEQEDDITLVTLQKWTQ